MPDPTTIVIGAGLAGLACARRLTEAGEAVVVLEKSRGVGGRAATRRLLGQAVDHGAAFYHATVPPLREALRRYDDLRRIDGWPRRLVGDGVPCVPGSLGPRTWRTALVDGMTAFPKRLAAGLDVRLETRVRELAFASGRWLVRDDRGLELVCRDLVLALPAAQGRNLLRTLGDVPELRSIVRLLETVGHARCLTTLAVYDRGTAAPPWDMAYPSGSRILHLASHDSSKRTAPDRTVLVLQALPGWSRTVWEQDDAAWSGTMLDEAARVLGRWAASPEHADTRRWRFARESGGGGLARPLRAGWPDGRRLGLTGEGFAPGGGLASAWRAGTMMADRLTGDDAAKEAR